MNEKALKNIKLLIQYDGTAYAGWQRQRNLPTVQGILEDVIKQITGEDVKVCGSGRTDAGAHALGQVANFLTRASLRPQEFKCAINALLPPDIVIVNAEEVPIDFHARKHAKSKIYLYMILNRDFPSAIWNRYCWWVRWPLNVDIMRKAAGFLVGVHDFSSFTNSGGSSKSTVRTVYRAQLDIKRDGFLSFEIEANGFLKQMVRVIVGTLVEVGRGRMDLVSFLALLEKGDRRLAGPTAPAKGLFLKEVKY